MIKFEYKSFYDGKYICREFNSEHEIIEFSANRYSVQPFQIVQDNNMFLLTDKLGEIFGVAGEIVEY